MKLIIHNGLLSYQYILDGRNMLIKSLIIRLAKMAKVEIIETGNGTKNYEGKMK